MTDSLFWGSCKGNSRGINWLEWDNLTIPKKHGCMGFRNIYAFNLAMLVKQVWKFIQCPEALVSKVFKARYFPHNDLLDVVLGSNPSYTWRSQLSSQSLLKEGTRWCIGSGEFINVCSTPWVSDLCHPGILQVTVEGVDSLKVKDLWLPGQKVWNAQPIHLLFPSNHVDAI